jgi:hypothetical protein
LRWSMKEEFMLIPRAMKCSLLFPGQIVGCQII